MAKQRNKKNNFPYKCKILRLDLLSVFLKYKTEKNFTSALLSEMQNKFGIITESDIVCVSEYFDIPKKEIEKVAEQNDDLQIIPVEQHVIKICMGTNCKNCGSEKLKEKISEELQIAPGETTKDGKFRLEAVDCVGLCEISPVIGIDDIFYGNVNVCDVLKLISHEKQKAED